MKFYLTCFFMFLSFCSGEPEGALDEAGLAQDEVEVSSEEDYFALVSKSIGSADLELVDSSIGKLESHPLSTENQVILSSSFVNKSSHHDHWSFTLLKDQLRGLLEEEKVDALESRVKALLQSFVEKETFKSRLNQVVNSFPHYEGQKNWGQIVEEAQSYTLEHVHLEDHIKIQREGSEKEYTALTFVLSLGEIELESPGNFLEACGDLSDSTEAVHPTGDTEFSHSNARSLTFEAWRESYLGDYVSPSEALLTYEMKLSLHFMLENMGDLHAHGAGDLEDKHYLTEEEVAAAAHSVAVIREMIEQLDSPEELKKFDVAFFLEPTVDLRQSTLHPVKSFKIDDLNCKKEVDRWLATPALMHTEVLHETHLKEGVEATPEAWSQMHDESFLEGAYPVTCTHIFENDTPQRVIVDNPFSGLSSCSTASGVVKSVTHHPYQEPEELELIGEESFALLHGAEARCQICTARFGGGTRVCLSELVEHNQVGDYWNIHLTDNIAHSLEQTAISGAAFLVKTAILVALDGGFEEGTVEAVGKKFGKKLAKFAVTKGLEVGAEELWDKVIKGQVASQFGTHVGGSMGIKSWGPTPTEIGEFFAAWVNYETRGEWAAAEKFALNSLVNIARQACQGLATGWQDQSGSSHPSCGYRFNGINLPAYIETTSSHFKECSSDSDCVPNVEVCHKHYGHKYDPKKKYCSPKRHLGEPCHPSIPTMCVTETCTKQPVAVDGFKGRCTAS